MSAHSDYSNVLQFRDSSIPDDASDPWTIPGDRLPAIFQIRYTNKITMCNYINGAANGCAPDQVVPGNQWFNLKFVQVSLAAKIANGF